MLQKSLFPRLAPVLCLLAGCGAPEEAVEPLNEIPLHQVETLAAGEGASPTDLKVFLIDGPAQVRLGDTLSLRAEAIDPEGQPLTFRWRATAGALSTIDGRETVWTATDEVGSADISVQAFDPTGNAVGAAFKVGVAAEGPINTVEDGYDSVGNYCSVAMDSSDRPHLTYYNSTHPSLKYAYWDGAQWKFETVEGYGLDIGGAAGTHARMVLDKSGNVHVAYLTQYASKADKSLNYAVRSGGKWTIVTLDDASGSAHQSVQIAMNPLTARPEILYQSKDTRSAMHIACSSDCTKSANWVKSTVWTETRGKDYSGSSGYGTTYPGDLTISADGKRHVTFDARYYIYTCTSYCDYRYYAELRYAVGTASAWDTTNIVFQENPGTSTYPRDTSYNDYASRLDLDASGQPLVLTTNGIYHKLTGGWNLSRVESYAMDQATFDLAVDRQHTPPSTGVVWMLSENGNNLELVKTNASGYFEYTYIGLSSSQNALAIDSSGQAHLCYAYQGALYYQ